MKKSLFPALFSTLFLVFTLFTFSLNGYGQSETFSYTGAVQTYVVPDGVTAIRIEAKGAGGGDGDGGAGGAGVCMEGTFYVTAGDVLDVIVGEAGLQYGNSGGGGGGSGVVFGGVPMIVAGAGGGAAQNEAGYDAVTTEDGVNSSGAGGIAGNGGEKGYIYNDCGWASGGGGFYGDGYGGSGTWDGGVLPGTLAGTGAGDSWASGGTGGSDASCTWTYPNLGGWGCGAGGAGGYGGAGGGGYSGGGGGQYLDIVGERGGGGGGSFNDGIDQVNTAGCNTGDGEITISVLCDVLTIEPVEESICEGEEIILDATSASGAAITWDGGVTDGVAFAPPVGVTTYTAISDDLEDCEFSIDIEVIAVPTVSITVDSEEICDGETVTFTEGGDADTYVWDPIDIVSGVPYSPAGIGTVTYTLTGTTGSCEDFATIDVTVYALPTVTATVDPDEICLGEEVVFTGGGDADSYTWDLGVTDGVPFTPAAIGTYTYTVTGVDATTGCENTATVDVTVSDSPTVIATADDEAVCEGDLVTLTGSGAATYTWDGGVTNGVPFAPPLGTTTYTVTGATLSGCEGMATIDITVTAVPTVTATADETEICFGEEITLTGGGADTYTWDGGVTDGVAFAPAGAGTITYTVTGTAGDGCTGTASIDIEVEALPTVIATASPTEICEGESIVFTGSGADIYAWDGGVTDGVPFTPGGSGDIVFNVIGSTLTGCENTASVTITVNPNPTVGATALTTDVCFGESTSVSGTGAMTYTWDGGLADGVTFTPDALGATTYTVTGTNAFGCQGTATITITVTDCEPVVPNFELPSAICVGDCITIRDLTTGAVVAWDWDFGGAASPGTSTEQFPEICVTSAGTYTITLTTTSHTGALSSISNNLEVFNQPSVSAGLDTIIDLGGSADLYAASGILGDFVWTPDQSIECPDCPITTVTPSESDTYTVVFTDINGCKGSDTVMVLVNFKEGVGVPTAFTPNGDGFNDVLFIKGYALASVSLIVYNRYGEMVFETTDQSIGWDGTFNTRDENPGVFTWVLQYEYLNGKKGKQKGNTTLIR
ncbi:gliding motility-associated C-terminal domain-containing protein [Crocinitomix sp.]|nr:gliding motility-associated C-terminal domain-containing protein [Crocinitomix sp.]